MFKTQSIRHTYIYKRERWGHVRTLISSAEISVIVSVLVANPLEIGKISRVCKVLRMMLPTLLLPFPVLPNKTIVQPWSLRGEPIFNLKNRSFN